MNASCHEALEKAQAYAAQIVDGSISPIEGALRIGADPFADCYDFLNRGSELIDHIGYFVGYADDWEEFQDIPEKREEIEAQMVSLARSFLRLFPG